MISLNFVPTTVFTSSHPYPCVWKAVIRDLTDTELKIFHFTRQKQPPEVFCNKKSVLRNIAKFTGKYLCQSLFFNKVAGLRPVTLLKKRLWHRYFPVNFAKFLRTSFLQNTSGRLLLTRNEISCKHPFENKITLFATIKIKRVSHSQNKVNYDDVNTLSTSCNVNTFKNSLSVMYIVKNQNSLGAVLIFTIL